MIWQHCAVAPPLSEYLSYFNYLNTFPTINFNLVIVSWVAYIDSSKKIRNPAQGLNPKFRPVRSCSPTTHSKFLKTKETEGGTAEETAGETAKEGPDNFTQSPLTVPSINMLPLFSRIVSKDQQPIPEETITSKKVKKRAEKKETNDVMVWKTISTTSSGANPTSTTANAAPKKRFFISIIRRNRHPLPAHLAKCFITSRTCVKITTQKYTFTKIQKLS